MPRRYTPQRRPTLPDIRYNSVLVGMIINRMMRNGKKSTARAVLYDALDLVADRTKREALEVLQVAMTNAAPTVEVKPKRVGGSTYQVPIEVSRDRGESLAMRWILMAARSRSGKSMAEKLASEILDAANNQGAAVKRKDETHRMAEANRAFAHYRW
ncbi:MAG TPA: 30S ribosomal protein S7 [Aggregatilineales bacterium]|nr:30S ribosomal protein S7 [Anaerolineales bacterium]HRE49205.1 30S ribosomal protein S7 [Aggregatilineales bacterium]